MPHTTPVSANTQDSPLNPDPYYAAYTIVQAMDRTGLGRSTLLEAIRAGDLKARRLNNSGAKKFLILPGDLTHWLESLPLAYSA